MYVCPSVHPCDIMLKRPFKELKRESKQEASMQEAQKQARTQMLEGIHFEEEESEPYPVGAC